MGKSCSLRQCSCPTYRSSAVLTLEDKELRTDVYIDKCVIAETVVPLDSLLEGEGNFYRTISVLSIENLNSGACH